MDIEGKNLAFVNIAVIKFVIAIILMLLIIENDETIVIPIIKNLKFAINVIIILAIALNLKVHKILC